MTRKGTKRENPHSILISGSKNKVGSEQAIRKASFQEKKAGFNVIFMVLIEISTLFCREQNTVQISAKTTRLLPTTRPGIGCMSQCAANVSTKLVEDNGIYMQTTTGCGYVCKTPLSPHEAPHCTGLSSLGLASSPEQLGILVDLSVRPEGRSV